MLFQQKITEKWDLLSSIHLILRTGGTTALVSPNEGGPDTGASRGVLSSKGI